jgi:predicted dehydrogenase
MTLHRIDLAQYLLGPIKSVTGALAQFASREHTADGQKCAPSEVDDWTSIIGQFESGCVGVWEGSTVMKAHHNNGFGTEFLEINGSDATAIYELCSPNTLKVGRHGEEFQVLPVPPALLTVPGSRRNPSEGETTVVFRCDSPIRAIFTLIRAIFTPIRAIFTLIRHDAIRTSLFTGTI